MKLIAYLWPLCTAIVNSQSTTTLPDTSSSTSDNNNYTYPTVDDPGCDSYTVYGSIHPVGHCIHTAGSAWSSMIVCNGDGTIDEQTFNHDPECLGSPHDVYADFCSVYNNNDADANCVEYCDNNMLCDVASMDMYYVNDSMCDITIQPPVHSDVVVLDVCVNNGYGGSSQYECNEFDELSQIYYAEDDCQGNNTFADVYPTDCMDVAVNETSVVVGVCGDSQFNGTYPPMTTSTTWAPSNMTNLSDPGCNSWGSAYASHLQPADVCLSYNTTNSVIFACNDDGLIDLQMFGSDDDDCSGAPISSEECTDCHFPFCDSGVLCDAVTLKYFNDTGTCDDKQFESYFFVADACTAQDSNYSFIIECNEDGSAVGLEYASDDCSGSAYEVSTYPAECDDNGIGNQTVMYCSLAPSIETTDIPDDTTGAPTIEPTTVVTQVSNDASTTLEVDDSSAWRTSIFMTVFVGLIAFIF